MANNKSAKKRILIAERNKQRNMVVKSKVKTSLKKIEKAIDSKDKNLTEALKTTVKVLDTSARKGIIHKNKAARLKSKLTKKINAIK